MLRALAIAPQSKALYSLLGLIHLKTHNAPAARLIFQTLIGQNPHNSITPSAYNNLGLVYNEQGKEAQAIRCFQQAAQLGSAEAAANLGYLALKYRNGALAKQYLDQAKQLKDNNAHLQSATLVAQLQNGEIETVRNNLGSLPQADDGGYSRLSAGYFLLDIEEDYGLAIR